MNLEAKDDSGSHHISMDDMETKGKSGTMDVEFDQPDQQAQATRQPQVVWLSAAVGASICFGGGSYFIGEVSKEGLIAKWLLSLGFFCVSIGYMLVVCTHQFLTKGYFWSLKKSDLWYRDPTDPKNGQFHTERFFGLIGAAVSNFVGTLFVALCFQYSIPAGVNQGVISTLFVLSSIFCAILAFIFMRETMDIGQSMGMVLMIICAVILSFAKNDGDVDPSVGVTVSPVVPVLMAILSSVAFGFRSIFIKYYVAEKGYDVYNLAVQHTAFDGAIGAIVLIIWASTGGSIPGHLIWKGILSGIIAGIGTILINFAISEGVAGPASACANLASVIQTLLDVFILGQKLNAVQIIGMILGLIGATAIAVGTNCYEWVVGKCKDKSD